MELVTMYENEKIKIFSTGRSYDFIGGVENKTSKDIWLWYNRDSIEKKVGIYMEELKEDYPDEEEREELLSSITYMPQEYFCIPKKSWVGIMADDAGRMEMELLQEGEYTLMNKNPSEMYEF